MTPFAPGSIISGTHRAPDLAAAFLGALRPHLALLDDRQRKTFDRLDSTDWSRDNADGEAMEELFDLMDAFAPRGCYFGAHPGDGADFGFWICDDAIDEQIVEGTLLKAEALSAVPEDWVGDVLVETPSQALAYYIQDGDTRVQAWSI